MQAGVQPTQQAVAANTQQIEQSQGEATVYFANGQVTVDPKFEPQLLALAKQAKTITAYIIQVQGYASAVGSAALNQKLERGARE